MSLSPVSNSVKALLLGLFCCLGVAAAKDGNSEREPAKIQLFSLNEVHPKSDQLVPEIEEGTAPLPSGYRLCKFPVLNEAGKKTGSTTLLVSIRNIVTARDVQSAGATGNLDGIAVLLTVAGGKRVSMSTAKMELGRDRMAVILEGEGLIAPTVQARLGRDFVINGLEGKKEVERVVLAFNAPIKDHK